MVDGLYALVHVVYLCLYPSKRTHPLTGDPDPDYHCLAFYVHQLMVAAGEGGDIRVGFLLWMWDRELVSFGDKAVQYYSMDDVYFSPLRSTLSHLLNCR
jgi:hypothetical protein